MQLAKAMALALNAEIVGTEDANDISLTEYDLIVLALEYILRNMIQVCLNS
jgi:hypothetical protein